MTKPVLALAALLAGDCLGRTPPSNRLTPKEYVHMIATGSPVEVRSADGSKLRGWISEVSDEGFVLNYDEMKQLPKRYITFDQVRAVKPVKSVKSSHATQNVLIGVEIGAVAIGAIVAIGVAASGGLNFGGNLRM